MAKARKGGLGKGLDVLFVDNSADTSGSVMLKITEIEPNALQPRREFEQEALSELADSIREHGVLSPILVRPTHDGGYQIVAGERRWRAARLAGLTEVPVLIRELSDSETMELALIENLQRENLNAVEEALGYKSLLDEHGMTQEQVAQRLGKSRSGIANSVRLLALPQDILAQVGTGQISAGHARALLSAQDIGRMREIAKAIVEDGITVRQAEKLAKAMKKEERPAAAPAFGGESYFKEMELALTKEIGRPVRIKTKGEKGSLEIGFYSKEDLANIAMLLCEDK